MKIPLTPPPPNPTARLPYWATHSYTQGEPNLVKDPIDISTDTTLSSLPETLSLLSTPSLSQISPTLFRLNFPNNLDARYREQSSTNIPLRLDWNTFVAPPPLFGQHQESNRLHSWALNRLQYRQDIHENIREHNIQILQQNSLQLKFEITIKLNNNVQHPYPLNPPINRVRHISQNQNTFEINRQIIHPRRNRNFQTPRVHFNIPQSPTPTTSELSSSTLPETPTLASQHSISNVPTDYLDSTPTSEQSRENPFNPTDTTERPPYWTTHSYTQGEPNLVNEPIDLSSDTILSSLPETLSLPSTPSISQISPTLFPTNLDARYQD